MNLTLTTTITTTIDVSTLTITGHAVDIATDDPIPQDVVMAAALGGCRSAVKTIEAQS